MPLNGAQTDTPDSMVEDGILFIKFILFLFFCMPLCFSHHICGRVAQTMMRMSYLRRTRKRMRRTFSLNKVHRVIVKTFFHKTFFQCITHQYLSEDNKAGTDIELDLDTDEQENSEPDVQDPYDRVYANVLSESHMLPSVPNCEHCNAKKFESELLEFCCWGGKIHLSTPETPPELMRLWSSSNTDARHFRANIRYFNGHFSFTSLYCHLDRVTTNM